MAGACGPRMAPEVEAMGAEEAQAEVGKGQEGAEEEEGEEGEEEEEEEEEEEAEEAPEEAATVAAARAREGCARSSASRQR